MTNFAVPIGFESHYLVLRGRFVVRPFHVMPSSETPHGDAVAKFTSRKKSDFEKPQSKSAKSLVLWCQIFGK